ncbi:hypothetical protein HOD61_01045 [archaeon]|jgi:20S proteasome alpha/beta subunit|nr:hypothetical protein [archaeon]
MTTIVGVKTTTGLDAIVLAADYTKTTFYGASGGNSINNAESGKMKKLYCARNFAFGFAGKMDLDHIGELWQKLKIKNKKNKNYIDVSEQLRNGYFEEIAMMNSIQTTMGDYIDSTAQTEFIFGTNEGDELSLHHVSPLGAVTNFDNYVFSGSGSEYVEEYLEDAYDIRSLDGPSINLRKAVNLARKSIHLAKKDMYSGTEILDFTIITKDSITYYGDNLRKKLKKFKNKEIKKIITSYH